MKYLLIILSTTFFLFACDNDVAVLERGNIATLELESNEFDLKKIESDSELIFFLNGAQIQGVSAIISMNGYADVPANIVIEDDKLKVIFPIGDLPKGKDIFNAQILISSAQNGTRQIDNIDFHVPYRAPQNVQTFTF